MLKVIGIHPNILDETIKTEDVVFSIWWNNAVSWSNGYWTARHDKMILEINMSGENFIRHICLVVIQPDWVTVQDEICLVLAVPEDRGLPICEWERKDQYGRELRHVDEQTEIRLCISPEDILIQFMPQTQIVRFITTDRVRFGIDADDHLTAIQVMQFAPDEIEAVKRTFVK